MAVSIIFIWGIDQAGVQFVTNYLCLSSNLLNLIFIVKEKCDSSVNDHFRVVLVSRFSYDFFPVYHFEHVCQKWIKRFFSRLYSRVIPFASLGYVLGNKKSERAIMLTLLWWLKTQQKITKVSIDRSIWQEILLYYLKSWFQSYDNASRGLELLASLFTQIMWVKGFIWKKKTAVLRQSRSKVRTTGCKENHFYSLPFGQAGASIY